MLLETPYKNGDTISLKLSSGEEILGRLDSETDQNITLHKPMVLIAQEKGLGLAPFMFSVSPTGKFVMKAASVLCITKTKDEISKQYMTQNTGSAL